MPAIITHHLFGEDAYASLTSDIDQSADARDAFLLGNQGPDPLLCLNAFPSAAGFSTLGATMHKSRPAELLYAVHQHFVERAHGPRASILKAYAGGFLCHYLLDSTAHPLVYAQQHAFYREGIDGLPPELEGREIHALIETDLDEYELFTKRGTTVAAFVPHREILNCNANPLRAISQTLSIAVEDAYDIELPRMTFAVSVGLYRAAQTALDSKRDGIRRHVDYAKALAGSAYLYVQAHTHTGAPRSDTPFANNDHVAWPHPFAEGETVSASFDELYEKALERALALAPEFLQPEFSLASCENVTGGVNFNGQRV